MSAINDKREVAIKLTGVKKQYKLGQIGGGTLTADLQSWWARIRGKEDPNSKIGQEQRLIGQTFMALNGIDLTVYKGEALGIIGGNGAGKSTMLKLLSRVTAPTEGEIDIYGRIASMLEVGTGFNGELTGRENVYMNGAILGMTKAEIDAKMEDIIEFSEVREFIDTPVKRYSSGMYVKLAFSVAAHLDSEIMIMDEVLAVGDINFQQKCLKKMRDAAKQEGRTVLYVSHNMSTIQQLCDRCIVMDQGKIIFAGSTEESIAIYSRAKQQECKLYYDHSNSPRSGVVSDKLHINSIQLKENVLNETDKLAFSLNFNCSNDKLNFNIRIIISNSINVIGTTFSDILTARSGDNNFSFMFDTSVLSPNDYVADIVLSEINDDVMIRHDSVNEAFAFTVEEISAHYNLRWSNRFWGNCRLPGLVVCDDN